MAEINFAKFMSQSKFLVTGLLATELFLSVLIGIGFVFIKAGSGAWILGGVAAGAIAFYGYRSFCDQEAQPNRNSRKVGQVLIGLTIGFSIQTSNLERLAEQLPIFLLITGFALCSGGAIGYLYSRLAKIDFLTAMLATTPGNLGVMASIAADYDKNTSLVSLVQLLRFTTVTIVVPICINLFAHADPAENVSSPISALINGVSINFSSLNITYLLLLGSVLLLSVIAVYIGGKLRIPVTTLLGPILVGLTFNELLNLVLPVAIEFKLPPLVNLLGQILLGITIGEYWGMKPELTKSTVAYAVLPTTLTLISGAISAGIALLLTSWDWLTCLLLTAPGGSPEMIWIALTLHHDVELVTAGHLIRLVAINLSLPALVSFACYLEARSHAVQLTVENTSTSPEEC